jgi:hypothetical protein
MLYITCYLNRIDKTYMADPYIYVGSELHTKLAIIKATYKYRKLRDVISDMCEKCYPEVGKQK